MPTCELDAAEDPTDALQDINLAKQCINCQSSGPTLGKPPVSPLARRVNEQCPAEETEQLKPQDGCQHTYTCDGSRFPNICANAQSAIQVRGKPRILTKIAKSGNQNTRGWHNDKDGTSNLRNLITTPAAAKSQRAAMGWGVSGDQLLLFMLPLVFVAALQRPFLRKRTRRGGIDD